MKLQRPLRPLLILILSLSFTACVSVSLPKASGKKATNLEFSAPAAPFQAIKTESADAAWLSAKTGNTISYLSDCESPIDPSVKQIESESLSALTNLKIESSDEIPYNGRQAAVSVASGAVDGVPVKMKLLVFKKNNCNYTLTYAGVEKNFSAEVKEFNRFIQSFKAP